VAVTESTIAVTFPVAVTLDRLDVFAEANATSTFTLRVNAADTTVTCTMTAIDG
jgi:hypothetical protein